MLTPRAAIASAALLATLLVAAAQARAPTGRCRSPEGTIIAINSRVVAYEVGRPARGRGNDSISGLLVACRRASGNKVVVSRSRFGDYWYDRPARSVKVRGSTVGYAAVVDAGYGSAFATQIVLLDMLHPSSPHAVSAGGLIGSIDFEVATQRRGQDLVDRRSAAWISCPDSDDIDNADPRPNCVKAGRSSNSVLAVARGSRVPVRLARGRSIDPRSVRIRGAVVSWLERGRRRSATLPPAGRP